MIKIQIVSVRKTLTSKKHFYLKVVIDCRYHTLQATGDSNYVTGLLKALNTDICLKLYSQVQEVVIFTNVSKSSNRNSLPKKSH